MTEISLSAPGNWVRCDNIEYWLNLHYELEAKRKAGDPIYVKFRDKRREGAVGRLVEFTFEFGTYRSYWGGEQQYVEVKDLVVEWDGRKNKVNPTKHEITWLPDHAVETGTVWAWNPDANKRPKKPKKIIKDRLGELVESGHFVCFVHRRWGDTNMRFGTVTRITHAGTVFVKTLKLRTGEVSEEVRCNQGNIVIVNDKLMSRLVMARMAAD